MLELVDWSKVDAEVEALQKKFIYNPKLNTLTLHIRYPYEIDLDRIQNYHDLVGWIHHMAGKIWIERDHIGYLIERICQIKEWRIY